MCTYNYIFKKKHDHVLVPMQYLMCRVPPTKPSHNSTLSFSRSVGSDSAENEESKQFSPRLPDYGPALQLLTLLGPQNVHRCPVAMHMQDLPQSQERQAGFPPRHQKPRLRAVCQNSLVGGWFHLSSSTLSFLLSL